MKRKRVAPSRVRPALSATSRATLPRKTRSKTRGDDERDGERHPGAIQAGSDASTANMVKAILLDALGTLIGFENPSPHLQSELQRARPSGLARAGRARRSAPRSPITGRTWTRAATPRRCMTCACAARRRWALDGVPTETRARRAARLPALLRLPGQRADADRAARAGDQARRRLQLGLLAARAPGRDRPHAAARRRARLRRGRLGQTGPARSSARRCSSPARRRADLARRRHARGRRGGARAAGIHAAC